MGLILGAIWSKFPGISRNLPKFSPGRPRVPPGKRPPEFRAFYRAFWGFTPWKWAVFPPRGVARGPRGVHLGKSRGFWGGSRRLFCRAFWGWKSGKFGQKSAKNRPNLTKSAKFLPRRISPDPPKTPENPPDFPPVCTSPGGFCPPRKPPEFAKSVNPEILCKFSDKFFPRKKYFFHQKVKIIWFCAETSVKNRDFLVIFFVIFRDFFVIFSKFSPKKSSFFALFCKIVHAQIPI
mgnify:FL=1